MCRMPKREKRQHFALCFHLFILIHAHLTSESQAAVYHCACQEVLSMLNRVSFVLAGAWVQNSQNIREHQSIHMPRVHHDDYFPIFLFIYLFILVRVQASLWLVSQSQYRVLLLMSFPPVWLLRQVSVFLVCFFQEGL